MWHHSCITWHRGLSGVSGVKFAKGCCNWFYREHQVEECVGVTLCKSQSVNLVWCNWGYSAKWSRIYTVNTHSIKVRSWRVKMSNVYNLAPPTKGKVSAVTLVSHKGSCWKYFLITRPWSTSHVDYWLSSHIHSRCIGILTIQTEFTIIWLKQSVKANCQ